ncbi:MAG: hypothetical protein K6G55_06370 [Selenomonadaceae bacterium]|nr:hypothetical protein [Selenomonadaceae bacterium]
MKFYPKILAMLTLCVFIPPLGWLVMYKVSPFDRRTNIFIAIACAAFFVYAQVAAGNLDAILGTERKSFEVRLTPEEFRKNFNSSAQKFAPNLSLEIPDSFIVKDRKFNYSFATNITLEGTINDEDKITELKIFAAPVNKDESFQTINVLGLLIATLNPELDIDDRSEVIRDLRMLKNVSTEEAYDWTTTRGKVKYSVHSDKGQSTFTAELL